jgi:hypothetical protein
MVFEFLRPQPRQKNHPPPPSEDRATTEPSERQSVGGDAPLRGDWRQHPPGISSEIWATLRPFLFEDLTPLPGWLPGRVTLQHGQRAWLCFAQTGDHRFTLYWLPSSKTLRRPDDGLVAGPITIPAGAERPSLRLDLRVFGPSDLARQRNDLAQLAGQDAVALAELEAMQRSTGQQDEDVVAVAELQAMQRSTGQQDEDVAAAAEPVMDRSAHRNNPLTDESWGSDPAEANLLRGKLVDYLAERIGDPAFDVFAAGWQTETDPLEVTSSGIESGQQAAHEYLVSDPIELLLAVGLGVPAPAANEAGAFAEDTIELPGDEFLGHLTFGLRIASIVLCVMSGNSILAAESTKSLLKSCFIDLMKKSGYDGLSWPHRDGLIWPHSGRGVGRCDGDIRPHPPAAGGGGRGRLGQAMARWARAWARRKDWVPVSMMLAPKVRRSTMAAQSRGSVKVLVQPEKDSLEAIATELVSSRSVRTWKSSSAPRRSSSM